MAPSPEKPSANGDGSDERLHTLSDTEVWSRTIGALGQAAWRRLRSLHVGVIGCGRSGSLAATALRQLGVRRFTLIDPDVLEPHNLGEMDGVGPADIGRPKVHAVAETLRQPDDCAVLAFADSILSLSALVVAKRADVLFCCVDSPAARLATACLAALYLKPLVDIGTGIFNESSGPAAPARRMGADVRLVLPGRCLLCLGGIADLARARTELLAGPAPLPRACHARCRLAAGTGGQPAFP
jgi:hypothetical protein